jgi:hypothetical protein
MLSTPLSNQYFEMQPQRLADVEPELNKQSELPGTLILNAFLESNQEICRFKTPRADFDYFYNAVVSSIKHQDLGDLVWVRKTVFSVDHGFSFLLFNLKLASPSVLEHYRSWKDGFPSR